MTKKDYLSRDDFLQLLTIEEEDLPLGNGQTVRIRPLTMTERNTLLEEHTREDGTQNALAMEIGVLCLGLVAPKLTIEDAKILREGRPGPADKIANRIMTISGMEDDIEKKAGGGS